MLSMLLPESGDQSWRVEQGLVRVFTTRTPPIRSSTNSRSSPNRYTKSSNICREKRESTDMNNIIGPLIVNAGILSERPILNTCFN